MAPDVLDAYQEAEKRMRANDIKSPNDVDELDLASLTLNENHGPAASSLCTTLDCPVKDIVHIKGFFMHNMQRRRGIRWHEDFGFSDPPPAIWAAYFRVHVQFRNEIGEHCRNGEDLVDLLMSRPYDNAERNDAEEVEKFMLYHAMDLQRGKQHIEPVPWRGRILSMGEPDLVKSYGVVFRAEEKRSSNIVALKQLRIPPEDRQNGVPITALREMSILRSLKHDNIVNVIEVAVGESSMDEVYMVMEYCEQVSDPLLRVVT
ncbi:MAG: hypothetical protein Q9220_007718 [cf. Caloplaca sp. 1 TL-2023]